MKKLVAFALLIGATTIANAREPFFAPAFQGETAINYEANYSPTPAGEIIVEDEGLHPVPAGSSIGTIVCDACDAQGIELYDCVKYIQTRKIHPCAVSKIVKVANPCYDPCCPCNSNPCVYVEICVPPCGCEEVRCSKGGDRTKFDYGKYAVKVTNRRGTLVVNYDS